MTTWAVLDGLAPDDRSRVLAAARTRRYRRGQALFRIGDRGDALHLVEAGRVAVRVGTPDGNEATIAVRGPGDHVGEQALVQESGTRTATVVALEPVVTLALHREAFEGMRRFHPSVERVLVATLADRLVQTTDQLIEALFTPADIRVERRLAALAQIYRADDDGPVDIPLTQDDLASMAGTSRPTANRALQGLERRGVVRLARGRIRVLDPGLLV
jgi:CRP-like cAMP-binding protein